jgi:hypothetical protein
MPLTLNGDGAISGLTATGISSVQNVGKVNLPSGSVLNAYYVSSNTALGLATTSQTDIPSLSITLTPVSSSSKFILLSTVLYAITSNNTTGFAIYAVRNGSNVAPTPLANYENYFPNASFNPSSIRIRTSQNFFDSPATTSSLTYKIQVAGQNATSISINNDSNFYSTLTILEIA